MILNEITPLDVKGPRVVEFLESSTQHRNFRCCRVLKKERKKKLDSNKQNKIYEKQMRQQKQTDSVYATKPSQWWIQSFSARQ